MAVATPSRSLKIDDPATNTLAPAATTNGAVDSSMPPSTSRSHPSLLCAIIWWTPPDLWQGRVDERLMSEARVDGHHQYLVDVWQDVLQHYRRGCWVNGYPDAFAQCLDAVHGAVQIVVAFPVDKKAIGAGLGNVAAD